MKEEKETERHISVLTGKADCAILSRFIARGIDALLVSALFFLLSSFLGRFLAIVAAAFYTVFQDSMGSGQSIGKRLIGIKVVDGATGLPCSMKASLIRNVPFLLWVVFGSVSSLWGFWALFALPVVAFETYLLLVLSSGMRLGDVLADTKVTETEPFVSPPSHHP